MDDEATDLYYHAKNHLHRRDYSAALRCFETALTKSRHNSAPDELIDLLVHIGNLYAQLGEHTRAREFYREVLDTPRENADPRAIGLTLVNLGNLCRESGERTRAEAYYLEARDLLIDAKDEQSLGILYSNLGLLAQDAGDPAKGLEYLKKAIELHKKTGYEAGLAATWGQMGRLMFKQGDTRDAETCFNYSATHFGTLGDPLAEAEALRGLAEVYEARPDIDLAFHTVKRVMETLRKYGLKVPQSDQDWLRRLAEAQMRESIDSLKGF
ncbi:MAG: tetratricopeptide repeat protein [Nitrospiria bacterium]